MVRAALLLPGCRLEFAEGDAAKEVGGESLLDVLASNGGAKVEWREFEDSLHIPGREQAEEIAEIFGGIDAVEPATGDERDEGGIGLSAVIRANKEPVLPIMRCSA